MFFLQLTILTDSSECIPKGRNSEKFDTNIMFIITHNNTANAKQNRQGV